MTRTLQFPLLQLEFEQINKVTFNSAILPPSCTAQIWECNNPLEERWDFLGPFVPPPPQPASTLFILLEEGVLQQTDSAQGKNKLLFCAIHFLTCINRSQCRTALLTKKNSLRLKLFGLFKLKYPLNMMLCGDCSCYIFYLFDNFSYR